MANVALPIEPTLPYWAIPTSLNGRTGFSVATLTVSPTLYFWSPAVPLSITTSFEAVGQRPAVSLSGLNLGAE